MRVRIERRVGGDPGLGVGDGLCIFDGFKMIVKSGLMGVGKEAEIGEAVLGLLAGLGEVVLKG